MTCFSIVRQCWIMCLATIAGPAFAEDGLTVSKGNQRPLFQRPLGVQRGAWLWVYWSDDVVTEPVISAHRLPDLKAVWTHKPETLITDRVQIDRWGNRRKDQHPGVTVLHRTADVLIYSGDTETEHLSVALDGQSGAARYRVPVGPVTGNYMVHGLSDRWFVAYPGRVFDAANGREITTLPGHKNRSLQFIDEGVVYLASTGEFGPPTHLRRVRLPSGELDADIERPTGADESADKPWNWGLLQLVWKDLAVMKLGGLLLQPTLTDSIRYSGIDIQSGQLVWTTLIPAGAPVIFLTNDADTPVLPADGRLTPYFERHHPIAPVPPEQAGCFAINLKTGERTFGSPLREPHQMLAWHGASRTDSPSALTCNADRVWSLLSRRGAVDTIDVLCLDLVTTDFVWRTELHDLVQPTLAIDDPHRESEHLVVCGIDSVHVLRRDTGEVIGTIRPGDVGATPRPPDRPPPGAARHIALPPNAFFIGPWLERLVFALPLVPLALWLAWMLVSRRRAV